MGGGSPHSKRCLRAHLRLEKHGPGILKRGTAEVLDTTSLHSAFIEHYSTEKLSDLDIAKFTALPTETNDLWIKKKGRGRKGQSLDFRF